MWDLKRKGGNGGGGEAISKTRRGSGWSKVCCTAETVICSANNDDGWFGCLAMEMLLLYS